MKNGIMNKDIFAVKLFSFERNRTADNTTFHTTEYALSRNGISEGISEHQKYHVFSG